MPFITQADCTTYIKGSRLTQILDNDNNAFTEAESTAVQVVKNALNARYNIASIFAATGANRDRQVMRWVTVLVLYYLYERIPDKLVPDSIIKNYDDVRDELLQVEDGKKSVTLPLVIQTDGTPITKFRWGSNTPRTH